MISLTALVLTYNEQDNIRRNLEALVWVPKVIIVDSVSNDETLEIARSFPNVQIIQRVFDSHANQWNAGLDRIDTEWTLTLDADYVLMAELQEEIKKLQPPSDLALYWGDFDYCIFGRPLRGSLYPPRVVLYRRSGAVYHNEGHGRRLTSAFEALEAFPALAASRNQVMRLFDAGEPSAADVVAAVEGDVALAISVLRLVIDQILEGLPPQYRRVIELRIAGCEIKDIARETGCSKRSVERVLQRFRDRLGAAMREEE